MRILIISVAALNEFQKIGQRVNAEYQEKYGVAPEPGLGVALSLV